MKRVMLDTNIYENILKYLDDAYLKKLVERKHLIIYGNAIIRKELREISVPKKVTINKRLRSLRIVLLNLYDILTGNHTYEISQEMLSLAEKYFVAYRASGGIKSKKEILNDFIIVASATIHDIDIVVSEDNKTILAEEALAAYKLVNTLDLKRTPKFIGFKEFTKELRGVNLD